MAKKTDAERLKDLDDAAKKIENKRKVLSARAEYRKALAAIKK